MHITKTKKKSKEKTKYASRYKTKKQSSTKQSSTKQSSTKQSSTKQKTLRIIFEHSPSLENDATIYKTEFLKQGYKVEYKLIDSVLHNRLEPYCDVNLFLEILPFKCKTLFPAKTNLFMPNNELFIDTKEDNKKQSKLYTYNRYEELKSIDFILCKTEICYKFFNFIKIEQKNNNKNKRIYHYETIYTKFTSSIDNKIKEIVDRDNSNTPDIIDPNLFIHLAGKSGFKNTPDLVHCWIKNKGFLDIDPDIKLVVTCYEHCSKWFNLTLKRFFKYDFEKDPNVSMNHKTNIATYKNMTIYFKSITPFSNFIDIITKANVAICISNKEGYGHYINEARYMKKFIITLDYPPMNELVKDKDSSSGSGNGIVLKNKNKFIKQNYKETKFNFTEAYPDSDELRDSIIWCINHKNELRKWGKNGRKMFLDDKTYFEDSMEKFIKNKL